MKKLLIALFGLPLAVGVVAIAFVASALMPTGGTGVQAADKKDKPKKEKALVIEKQGSFLVGGTVITNPGTFDPTKPTPAGQTFHGDHAYVQFQIPPKARVLPLVMWHGGGQFSKTWESTPDGREGYRTIFLRRGFAVYILDQPRRGRAGRSTVGITITPIPSEQEIFASFRLGIYPNFFPNVQFPRDPAALDQFFRQQTPDTGPLDLMDVIPNAGVALFDKIGPAVLITHSQSGVPGWITAIRSQNVKAIIAYEPNLVFPEGEVPGGYDLFRRQGGLSVSPADFAKLTKIPIQIVFGDNIPTSPSPIPGLEFWRGAFKKAVQFRDAVNRRGGQVSILHLPDVGLFGNTHFLFSDLNNLKVADLLSQYLHDKGLDKAR